MRLGPTPVCKCRFWQVLPHPRPGGVVADAGDGFGTVDGCLAGKCKDIKFGDVGPSGLDTCAGICRCKGSDGSGCLWNDGIDHCFSDGLGETLMPVVFGPGESETIGVLGFWCRWMRHGHPAGNGCILGGTRHGLWMPHCRGGCLEPTSQGSWRPGLIVDSSGHSTPSGYPWSSTLPSRLRPGMWKILEPSQGNG